MNACLSLLLGLLSPHPPATQTLHHWDFPQGFVLFHPDSCQGGLLQCAITETNLLVSWTSFICTCQCSGLLSQTCLSHTFKSDWWCWEEWQDITMDAQGVTLASFRGDCAKEWATKALCVGDDEQWNAGLCWKPVCHVTPVTPHPPPWVLAVKRQPLLCIFTHPPGT